MNPGGKVLDWDKQLGEESTNEVSRVDTEYMAMADRL